MKVHKTNNNDYINYDSFWFFVILTFQSVSIFYTVYTRWIIDNSFITIIIIIIIIEIFSQICFLNDKIM